MNYICSIYQYLKKFNDNIIYNTTHTTLIGTSQTVLDLNFNYRVFFDPQRNYFTSFGGGTNTYGSTGNTSLLTISNSPFDYATLQSRRRLKYVNTGSYQAKSIVKFSQTPIGGLSGLLFGNTSDVYGFADFNGSFGILITSNGLQAVAVLSVLTNPSGIENITITLSGVSYTFNINVSTSLSFTAYQLSTNTFGDWLITHINDSIYFLAGNIDERNGVYSFTNNTGGGTMTATISQSNISTTPEFNFVPQNNWISAIKYHIDPYTWNYYSIEVGNGIINFSVLDPNTQRYEIVYTIHELQYSLFPTPSLYLSNSVVSLGSTTAFEQEIAGMSVSYNDGLEDIQRLPTQTISNTKMVSVETNLLTVANRNTLNTYPNYAEGVLILGSFACEGNKPTTFRLVLNPSTVGAGIISNYTNYQFIDANSPLIVDLTSTTYTGGQLVYSITLQKLDSIQVDFREFTLFISTFDRLVVSAQSATTSDVSCSLVFIENR